MSVSKSSVETLGRNANGDQADPFREIITDKQTLHFATKQEPVQFKKRSIILVFTAFSIFYLLVFVIGLTMVFTISYSTLEEARKFDKIVKEATECYKCIVSDEEWPGCSKEFCSKESHQYEPLTRNIYLLHGDPEGCKEYISYEESLNCYKWEDVKITNESDWTEWSKPNKDGEKYRIRKFKADGLYNIDKEQLQDLCQRGDKTRCLI